jgi:hypothetical protein
MQAAGCTRAQDWILKQGAGVDCDAGRHGRQRRQPFCYISLGRRRQLVLGLSALHASLPAARRPRAYDTIPSCPCITVIEAPSR